MPMAETPQSCSTVYYDGACPVCQREIAYYKRKTAGSGVQFVDATSCDEGELGSGLQRDMALARLHVRRPDGKLVSGAAAFGEIWRSVPGFRFAGQLAQWGPVTFLLDLVYRCLLKIRPYLQPLLRP